MHVVEILVGGVFALVALGIGASMLHAALKKMFTS
jgi:hypothetical protein